MAERYADVIVNIANGRLDRAFSYRIPDELSEKVREGSRVRVPFGRGSRMIDGYVIATGNDRTIDDALIKPVDSVYENAVTVEERLVRLAAWMRSTYGSTMIQALKTVLPVRERKKVREDRTLRLIADTNRAGQLLAEYDARHYAAKKRLMEALLLKGELSWEEAVKKENVTPALIRKFEEDGILRIERRTVYRKPESDPCFGRQPKPLLNEEQQACLDGILAEWESPDPAPCLIHGVTGSGKTNVYMELIERVLAAGKQVIFLIPEIALTWQTFSRFYERFGDAAALLNSRMSAGERSDLIERVEKGEVRLVIGPRSALFTPFPDLGLIIIDEEHDDSYKSEKAPRYHARETALERARMEQAFVVLGSATPSIDASCCCERGTFRLFRLTRRYADAPLPEIRVVDMRQELKHGNRSIISAELAAEMEACLEKKEQIMLFLNRRGYSGNFSCRSCGYVVKCPHCDVALTLHNDGFLKCHYCGYQIRKTGICPSCGSHYIGGMSIGTQQAEEEIGRLFPQARILRMDRDTTGGRNDYERILKSFREKEAEILIGTQMIAKGHDFPNVTLVGILSADISLFAGDYRAAEKTYEILTQEAGRAGRGSAPGKALIQTYHPDHYVIEAVTRQDYEEFYREEAANRGLLSYPPFGHILGIHASCAEENRLDAAMRHIRIFLEKADPSGSSVIMGPGREEIYKIQDAFRMVLYIKSDRTQELIRLRKLTERYMEINRGFDTVSVQFDLDA